MSVSVRGTNSEISCHKRISSKILTAKRRAAALLLALSLVLSGCALAGPVTLDDGQRAAILEGGIGRFDGLCFTPYEDGQSAETTPDLDEAQLCRWLEAIAPYTDAIRTYGSERGLEKIPRIASELGLEVVTGAYIGMDPEVNAAQIASAVANAPYSTMICVGNEALNLGTASRETLLDAIRETRAQLDAAGYPDLPVTTNETYDFWRDDPALLEACDVMTLSYHPYFGEPDAYRAATVHLPEILRQAKALAGDTPLCLGEIGWPSYAGDGDPEAARQDAALFITLAVRAAREMDLDGCYVFINRDELWKQSVEGPVGTTWGVWTSTGELKYPELFPEAAEAAQTPVLRVTQWPSPSGWRIVGEVSGVSDVSDVYLMLYITVAGQTWVKPTYADAIQPLLPSDTPGTGTFSIPSNSHANDVNADSDGYYLLLMPRDYTPADVNDLHTNMQNALLWVQGA
ncbi:hypothetical protein LJC74_08530 [Eubacteriales bacterium OttesenSCG-928-A19]|nr:hypothetical protein [Eubacteriales bacterium OttesenSCG-928-A19]